MGKKLVMDSAPLVSVLMNCFNGEKYLREAIDSIINQTYKNWELVFWDNQSTDKSLDNHSAHGEVINIASGKPISIKKMINTIVDIIGSGEPQFGQVVYRDGENMALYGDTTKAKEILGWKSSVSLRQGLLETIKWVKN